MSWAEFQMEDGKLCVHVRLYIRMRACMSVLVHAHMGMCVCGTCVCMYVCAYVCASTYMRARMRVCVRVHVRAYMHLHVCHQFCL